VDSLSVGTFTAPLTPDINEIQESYTNIYEEPILGKATVVPKLSLLTSLFNPASRFPISMFTQD